MALPLIGTSCSPNLSRCWNLHLQRFVQFFWRGKGGLEYSTTNLQVPIYTLCRLFVYISGFLGLCLAGLCLWTLMGYFRSPDPWCCAHPTSKPWLCHWMNVCVFKLDTPAELRGQLTQSSVSESDYANLDDVYDSTTDHFTGPSVITGSTQPLTVTGTLVKNFFNHDSIIASYTSAGITIGVTFGGTRPTFWSGGYRSPTFQAHGRNITVTVLNIH